MAPGSGSVEGKGRGWHSYCLSSVNYSKMKKILLGALVCAAVAGVVYYLNDPQKFNDTLDDLKNKADDALGKAKKSFGNAEKEYRNTVG